MEDFEHIRKLIALKRYETPGEEYFERFHEEFRERQRAEMLKIPVHQLMWDRFTAWMDRETRKVWFRSAGVACASLIALLGVVLLQTPEDSKDAYVETVVLEPDEPALAVTASLLHEF